MERKLDVNDIAAFTQSHEPLPTECPRCHHAIDARHVHTVRGKWFQIIHQCPRTECNELFIETLELDPSSDDVLGRTFKTTRIEPKTPKRNPFPESIRNLSQPFIDIHDQAMAAESHGLTEMVGIGLRKSFEFLIKDFVASKNVDDAEKIRGIPLAQCINPYVADPNVKECAKPAAWLGNDETHYVRKWETKDINDLKILVRLTINWIENTLLTEKYMAEMTEGKKG